jgi:hypothetical protein
MSHGKGRQSMRMCRQFVWLLVLVAGSIVPNSARGGAEIFAITPETAPAGAEVQIRGRELKGTKHVLFAVGGTVKTARFRVLSDEELRVVTPEYYRPGAAATVAVLGPTGLAVAVPAAVQTIRSGTRGRNGDEPGAGFYHVFKGGRVQSAESVALIELGGVVNKSRTPAMQLVKKGGVLMEFSNPNGIIFHEHGAFIAPAILSPRHSPAQRVFHVQKITASPGVGPFIYQGTPRPDAAGIPAVPPSIEAVVPPAAGAGDVISLKGRGFARTTEVLFLNQNGQSRSAGFRVVSDQHLKVEVPDKDAITGPQLVLVVTTEGLTMTLPRGGILRPEQTPPGLPTPRFLPHAILWLGEGDDAADSGINHLVFIAQGGRVGTPNLGSTFFVQRGGALADDRRPPAVPFGTRGVPGAGMTQNLARAGLVRVFYEPGAILPEELKQAPAGRETPAIVPSFFDQPFVILPGPLFRP